MLFHIQIWAADCSLTALEPSVREMLQIPPVRKSGSFKSVLLAEVADFPSGVCYKAVCGTWQQLWDNKTSIPRLAKLHAKFCPSVTSLPGPVSESNLETSDIGGTCYARQRKTPMVLLFMMAQIYLNSKYCSYGLLSVLLFYELLVHSPSVVLSAWNWMLDARRGGATYLFYFFVTKITSMQPLIGLYLLSINYVVRDNIEYEFVFRELWLKIFYLYEYVIEYTA